MGRVVHEQRVQGVDAYDVGTAFSHLSDQLREIAEVPDAPVARGAQCIQLHRRSPGLATVLQCRRTIATLGCADHQCLAGQVRHAEAMVAGGQAQAERQLAFAPADAVEFGAVDLGQRIGGDLALVHSAGFVAQLPADVSQRGGQPQQHVPRQRRRLNRHHRRQRLAPGTAQHGIECVRRVRFVSQCDAEIRQQGQQARACCRVARAPDVIVLSGNAKVCAQLAQRLRVVPGPRARQDCSPVASERRRRARAAAWHPPRVQGRCCR